MGKSEVEWMAGYLELMRCGALTKRGSGGVRGIIMVINTVVIIEEHVGSMR